MADLRNLCDCSVTVTHLQYVLHIVVLHGRMGFPTMLLSVPPKLRASLGLTKWALPLWAANA